MSETPEMRLADAQRRVSELAASLGRDTMAAWRAAHEDQLQAERELAAARGEPYARVIDLGLRWDVGAPLPHLLSNGTRAFVACLANEPDPDWDGTCVTVRSPGDAEPSPFVIVELWGCAESRLAARTTRRSPATRCTATACRTTRPMR